MQGLQYGRGMPNVKIGVMEIDNSKGKVEGSKIPNISSYHSIAFKHDHMILWRYFNIGTGVTQKYTNVAFSSGIKSISPYTSNEFIDDNKGKKTSFKKAKNKAKRIKESVQTFVLS